MEKKKSFDWYYVISKVMWFAILLLLWMTFGAPLLYGLLISDWFVALQDTVKSEPTMMIGIVGGVIVGLWLGKFVAYEVLGIGSRVATSPETDNA